MTMAEYPNCPNKTLWLLGPEDYRDELNRRSLDRQARRTGQLTVIATIATVIATLAALLPLLGQALEWLKELMACPWPE